MRKRQDFWHNHFFMTLAILSCVSFAGPVFAEETTEEYADTENPLYFENSGDFVSRTATNFSDSILRLRQQLSYGLNENLAAGIDINYQQDFDGDEDGFSNVGFDLRYRVQDEAMVSEFFGGLKVSGRARVPEYADTVYFVGTRLGRTWNWFTLAGTLQSSWIFDDVYGMAYIDFIPEFYFSLPAGWSIGTDFTFRKSTQPIYDQEWMGLKVAKQYNHTTYVVGASYEFEAEELKFSMNANILF